MILFRADGNSLIGTGHIMRCLAIADRLKEKCECVFVTADDGPAGLLEGRGYRNIVLNTDYRSLSEEKDRMKELMETYQPSVVFVDSYFAAPEYFKELKEVSERVVLATFDDMRKETFPCDILIHYGIGGEDLKDSYLKRYRKANIRVPELLLGGSFTPLRAEFQNLSFRKTRDTVQEILILTGGADVSNTAADVLKYLSVHEKYSDRKFHFVVGKLNPFAGEIDKLASEIPNAVVHTDVTNMSGLMTNADIAVSAGGTTIMELCACGTPLIAYVCADNQIEGVKNVVKKTGAYYAGDATTNNMMIKDLFSYIDILCKNADLRSRISKNEQEEVDGNGAERIAAVLLKYTES